MVALIQRESLVVFLMLILITFIFLNNKKSLVSPPVETEHEYSADGETRDDVVDDFMESSFKCCVVRISRK